MIIDLAPAMIYYSQRYRARLIGITTDTDFLHGLKRFALETVLPQETAALQLLSQAAFYQAAISEAQRKAEEMIEGAQTIEQKREIHPRVTHLYEVAKQATQELERLNSNGS